MQSRKTHGALRLTTFFHRFQLVAQRLVLLGACGLLSVLVPVHSWAGGSTLRSSAPLVRAWPTLVPWLSPTMLPLPGTIRPE
jgi:hypothetical protein